MAQKAWKLWGNLQRAWGKPEGSLGEAWGGGASGEASEKPGEARKGRLGEGKAERRESRRKESWRKRKLEKKAKLEEGSRRGKLEEG